MHFIGRLETLEHDLALLCKHLNISMGLGGTSLHYASADDAYKSSLDTSLSDDDIRSVCEHLAQDYVCFGYTLPVQCKRMLVLSNG
jgi:hypothetical protein